MRADVHLHKICGLDLRILCWHRRPNGPRLASDCTIWRNHRWHRIHSMELAPLVGARLARFISAGMACTHRPSLSARSEGLTDRAKRKNSLRDSWARSTLVSSHYRKSPAHSGSKRIYTGSKHSHRLPADAFAGKNGIDSPLRKPGRSHQPPDSDLCPLFPFKTVGHRKFS